MLPELAHGPESSAVQTHPKVSGSWHWRGTREDHRALGLLSRGCHSAANLFYDLGHLFVHSEPPSSLDLSATYQVDVAGCRSSLEKQSCVLGEVILALQ